MTKLNSVHSLRRFIATLWGVLLLSGLAACGGTSGQQAGAASAAPAGHEETSVVNGVAPAPPEVVDLGDTPAKQQECPALDSTLYQLTLAADPAQAAADLGLVYDERGIQVLVTLNSDDPSVLDSFDVVTTGSSGPEFQAFAPFDQLCALANTPDVLAVRIPNNAQP